MLRTWPLCTAPRLAPAGAAAVEPSLEFKLPDLWLLNIGPRFKNVIAFVPINEKSTRYYLRSYRLGGNARLMRPFDWLMSMANRFILNQDRRAVAVAVAVAVDRLRGPARCPSPHLRLSDREPRIHFSASIADLANSDLLNLRIRCFTPLAQDLFRCVRCHYTNHADVVGAINVVERGLRLFACGGTAHLGRPAKQEPTDSGCRSLSAVGISGIYAGEEIKITNTFVKAPVSCWP